MRALLLATLAALLAGCAQDALAPPAPDEGSLGPAWSFVDTEGATRSRDAPPGEATVLFFMASWCSTCRTKAPILAEAHEAFAARGVRFLSISVDVSDDAATLDRWREERAQPWPHGVDPSLATERAFGVTSQSSVVVLDADGRLVERWGYGAVERDGLFAAVERALA